MQKPISRMQHGIVDWISIPVIAALPYLAGFGDVPTARSAAWITSVILLGGVIATRAEWGILKLLPYRLHLWIDACLGALMMISPWALGFSGSTVARNMIFLVGAAIFSAGALLSRLEEMPSTDKSPRTGLETILD